MLPLEQGVIDKQVSHYGCKVTLLAKRCVVAMVTSGCQFLRERSEALQILAILPQVVHECPRDPNGFGKPEENQDDNKIKGNTATSRQQHTS